MCQEHCKTQAACRWTYKVHDERQNWFCLSPPLRSLSAGIHYLRLGHKKLHLCQKIGFIRPRTVSNMNISLFWHYSYDNRPKSARFYLFWSSYSSCSSFCLCGFHNFLGHRLFNLDFFEFSGFMLSAIWSRLLGHLLLLMWLARSSITIMRSRWPSLIDWSLVSMLMDSPR